MADDGYDYDLGKYSRRVSTSSEAAQLWFNRGLIWSYGFNHEEAIVCFEKALERDPSMAMAHWGIAYAIGPNYNKPWAAFDPGEQRAALARARAEITAAAECAGNAAPIEKALIAALAERWRHVADDFDPAHDAYADAMRPVYAAYSDDLDVCTLFAEALMNRTAWKLWDIKAGKPAEGASTVEARQVLETAFTLLGPKGARAHPGLLHLYVHLMEMSPHPELALNAGDVLADLVPDAGHLRHMPTHIDVLTGAYHDVVARNSAAISADKKFLERSGPFNFYSLYRCHNYHFKIYGAMFLGRFREAIGTADAMTATLPREFLMITSPPMADWAEAFVPLRQHVLIRFGRWREILAQDLPDDPVLYSVTTAMMRYARTVALAATGKVAEATAEREAFLAAYDRVPDSRMLFNNTCRDILKIAEAMLTGELEYRRGNHDVAFGHLRRAVELDDSLPYDEPWGWMQPTRHALGALLLEQGRADEAEAVYRADLGLDGTLPRACQHPDNVWSLHGLHECLVRRGERVESKLIKQRLDLAAARADVPVVSSCYCRLNHAA
jgi:tetratricopeptide (TPR) repeat protein